MRKVTYLNDFLVQEKQPQHIRYSRQEKCCCVAELRTDCRPNARDSKDWRSSSSLNGDSGETREVITKPFRDLPILIVPD